MRVALDNLQPQYRLCSETTSPGSSDRCGKLQHLRLGNYAQPCVVVVAIVLYFVCSQFRHVPGNIFTDKFGGNLDLATNELVIRIQPKEAIYLKINNKVCKGMCDLSFMPSAYFVHLAMYLAMYQLVVYLIHVGTQAGSM